MKSPLNQVIGLGSAKSGVAHWWHQRLTAIALIPLGLWFGCALLGHDLGSYQALVDWLREPLTAVLLGLTVVCLVYHSSLGVRVVLEDYVGGEGSRRIALLLSFFLHAFLLAVCLFSVLRVALGAS